MVIYYCLGLFKYYFKSLYINDLSLIYFTGMLTDLYIDKFKFRGINVKSKIPSLMAILADYNLQDLIDFFET